MGREDINYRYRATQEGIEEFKNTPQVYTIQEGIEDIKNNPQVYTIQGSIEEIKKTLGIHHLSA